MSIELTCYGTEDCEPWGVFAHGHVDPALITVEAINVALDAGGFEPIDHADVEHLYMAHDEEDAGEDGMFPWHWCQADTDGAVAITGIKF